MTLTEQHEFSVTNTSFKLVRPASGEGPEGTSILYGFVALANGEVVGHGTGYSLVVTEQVAHCSNSLELGGRGVILFGGAEGIRIEGDVISPLPSEVPVLGGTGEFAGVAGSVSLGPVPGTQPLEHRLVFNLLWP
jgi:hypothetical protein